MSYHYRQLEGRKGVRKSWVRVEEEQRFLTARLSTSVWNGPKIQVGYCYTCVEGRCGHTEDPKHTKNDMSMAR